MKKVSLDLTIVDAILLAHISWSDGRERQVHIPRNELSSAWAVGSLKLSTVDEVEVLHREVEPIPVLSSKF
jgi:hypothetical protein